MYATRIQFGLHFFSLGFPSFSTRASITYYYLAIQRAFEAHMGIYVYEAVLYMRAIARVRLYYRTANRFPISSLKGHTYITISRLIIPRP